jgi:hypothetical protein
MACELRLTNETPLQLVRLTTNSYPIRVSLVCSGSSWCRFKDERVTAIIDGVAHPMMRVYPASNVWTYSHQAFVGFNAHFIARYRSRLAWAWLLPWQSKKAVRQAQFTIIAAPAVTVAPTELMFYFDQDVPNTDQTVVLNNGLLGSVHVMTASIQTDPNSTFGAGGAAYFTLVSPTAFDFLVPAGGTQDFVVRFSSSSQQRNALLVIVTDHGSFTVRLSGKYFVW